MRSGWIIPHILNNRHDLRFLNVTYGLKISIINT